MFLFLVRLFVPEVYVECNASNFIRRYVTLAHVSMDAIMW